MLSKMSDFLRSGLLRLGAVAVFCFAYATSHSGCSKVAFQNVPPCEKVKLTDNCVNIDSKRAHIEDTVTVGLGTVDILFIDDNSGSMHIEQAKMADRFTNFINSLKNLDFRIAITTTDVSASPDNGPRAINEFGALQDGKLIEFKSGLKVLKPDTPNLEALFKNTIQRNETKLCMEKKFKASECPSGDERAIYAADLAVERGDVEFFRKDSHLAIIILSDEDERSNGGGLQPLETRDFPATLIATVKNKMGSKKTFSAHSIIIKPGDLACWTEQNAQAGLKGFYGHNYAELSNLTGGHTGSICASDYGLEVGKIGAKIIDHVNSIELECKPVDDEIDVTFVPDVNVTVTLDPDLKTIFFSEALPPNTQVHLSYDCFL